jgi:hypothetical protein
MVAQILRSADPLHDLEAPELAVIQRADGLEDVVGPSGLVRVARRRFVLRLLLGEMATVSWWRPVINVVVPEGCGIEPFGRSPHGNVSISRTRHLVPGSPVWARTLVVEPDGQFATAIRQHIVVTLPGPGRWPVLVLVAGESPIGWICRALVEFVPRCRSPRDR